MNIRKSLNKVFLSAATFFWASCGSDSTTNPETPESGTVPSSQSMAPLESSSSEAIPEPEQSSSSETKLGENLSSSEGQPGDAPVLSSATEPVESSSSTESLPSSSSYSQYPYKLASDTTVSCRYMYVQTTNCITYASSGKKDGPDARSLQHQLEYNQTRTLEELEAIEDTLELTPYMDEPVYGVPSCVQYETYAGYSCTDNKRRTETQYYLGEDNMVHLREVESSSSAEPSSSSQAPAPSPLCQKIYFEFGQNMRYNQLDEKLNNLQVPDSVSPQIARCAYTKLAENEREEKFIGSVARIQICDGDTTDNKRYLDKLDSINAQVEKIIGDCKDADNNAE